MVRTAWSTRLVLAVLLASFAVATYALRWRADALRPVKEAARFDIPALPADIARPFSFGLRSVVADVMFLQAIQVHGSQRKARTAEEGAADDRAINRLLTYATDVDPKFAGAYRFAGNAMPRHTTDGKATNVLQARAILKKGVLERPDDWRIPFTLGFIETYYLGEFAEAAHHLAQAARAPGSPAYVAFLATRAAAEGGDLDFGFQLANAMAAQANEESTQKEWQRRLLDLRMERDLRTIDAAVERYRQRLGRAPGSLQELVRAGDLDRIPAEPHGGRYELDSSGEARSTAGERLRIRGRYGTMAGLEIR
ncbi:MAG TPA: hypothetical protein VG496_19265 [Myxococcales bacterium]|nr:hypothetical protein [Myxococcales bacterium]